MITQEPRQDASPSPAVTRRAVSMWDSGEPAAVMAGHVIVEKALTRQKQEKSGLRRKLEFANLFGKGSIAHGMETA